MTPDAIEALRNRLNSIDAALLGHLSDRQSAVNQIASVKAETEKPIRDLQRERELLERLAGMASSYQLDASFVVRVFQEILDHSVRRQQDYLLNIAEPPLHAMKRPNVVMYLGSPGSYSHRAATRHFSATKSEHAFVGGPNFEFLIREVEQGRAGYAILPIENTTAGSINEVYDLLVKHHVSILGEEIEKVDHCLVGFEGTQLDQIRRIISHPQAFAQCDRFLRTLEDCRQETVGDTASAVIRVRDEKDRSQAAIASAVAAQEANLVVLQHKITSQERNYTRFVVVGAKAVEVHENIPCKTSIVFHAKHEKGALLKVLNCLAGSELNLTKLESRPLPDTPWSYRFFVDFEGNQRTKSVQEALRHIKDMVEELVVLGSYPGRNIAEALPVQIDV
jgi:chorismate mutase / prephenate dehydratase